MPWYDVLLCFGVMYGEWYGICDFVVFSVVEICVDYGGVYVFHVCFDLCIVYGVGICDVEGVWGVVIFIVYVMNVVVGVPLCVFRRVDVVCC